MEKTHTMDREAANAESNEEYTRRVGRGRIPHGSTHSPVKLYSKALSGPSVYVDVWL